MYLNSEFYECNLNNYIVLFLRKLLFEILENRVTAFN